MDVSGITLFPYQMADGQTCSLDYRFVDIIHRLYHRLGYRRLVELEVSQAKMEAEL